MISRFKCKCGTSIDIVNENGIDSIVCNRCNTSIRSIKSRIRKLKDIIWNITVHILCINTFLTCVSNIYVQLLNVLLLISSLILVLILIIGEVKIRGNILYTGLNRII